MGSPKVVQLSSVHPVFDPRIFHKISKSLVSHGYNVDLIIQHEKDEVIEGVSVKALPLAKKKLDRILKIIPILFFKCLKYPKNTIFHFHDPELIPIGLVLNILGYKVVYDIHEDYSTDILQKNYLPKQAMIPLLKITLLFEYLAYKYLNTVIAEEYYDERFASSVKILNFPILDWASSISINRKNPNSLLYTGNISEDRGALIHSNLLNNIDSSFDIRLRMVGRCSSRLYEKMQKMVGEKSKNLSVYGIDEYVDFNKIISEYKKEDWIAALAIFPKTKHYEKKHLTKFFEYMAAGIPIIYTNFPEWEQFLGPLGVGFAVDPDSPEEAVDAIKKLKEDQGLRLRMAENGRRTVFEKFDWDNEEKKLLKLYNNLS